MLALEKTQIESEPDPLVGKSNKDDTELAGPETGKTANLNLLSRWDAGSVPKIQFRFKK